MGKFVKTKMKDKRRIPGRGVVRHFGVRHRNEEPSNSGKDKVSVVAKADDVKEEHHRSWTGNMSHLAQAMMDAVRVVEPDLVNDLNNLMSETVEKHGGQACDAYPAGSCGLNGGYSAHLDESDATFGTLAGFGKDGAWMALPEYGAMARMDDGDVLVLNSGEVAHANVSHPKPPPGFQRATISLYWNKKQVGFMRSWKRQQDEDEKRACDPKAERAHAFWTTGSSMKVATTLEGLSSEIPSHCILGLQSAVSHFETVILWVYGDVTGDVVQLPGLEVRDACERTASISRSQAPSGARGKHCTCVRCGSHSSSKPRVGLDH